MTFRAEGSNGTSAAAASRDRAVPASVSCVVLLLGAAAIAAWLGHLPAVRILATSGFALLGIGTAAIGACRVRRAPETVVLVLGVSLSLPVLLSFAMLELRVWYPIDVGVAIAVATATFHLYSLGHVLRSEAQARSTNVQIHLGASEHRGKKSEWMWQTHWTWISVALALVGTSVCLVTAALSSPMTPPAEWGFLKAIPLIWYVGVALVAASFVVSRRAHIRATAVSALSIVLTLTGSQAIAFSLPRYPWTFKHIGVTESIIKYGLVKPKVDIYNAWPGFFGAMAWLCRMTGVSDPTQIARWWPLFVDLICLVLAQALARRILGGGFQSWLAAVLLFLANDLGDQPHYYSPQSLAYMLAIAIFALSFAPDDESMRSRRFRYGTLVMLGIAISVSHQVTPFLAAAALIVLVVMRLARPWWTPLALLVPAVAWALDNFHYVQSNLQLGRIGDIFGNLLLRQPGPPTHLIPILHINTVAIVGASVVVGALAVIATIKHHDRMHYGLCLAAATSVLLIVITAYGAEGTFRVSLFALPWLAIAAASLAQFNSKRIVLLPIIILIVTVFSVVGETGLDWYVAVPTGNLALEQAFELHAPRGSVLTIVGYQLSFFPFSSTYRYDNVTFKTYDSFRRNLPRDGNASTPQEGVDANRFANYAARHHKTSIDHVYAVFSTVSEYQGVGYGQYTVAQFLTFERAVLGSKDWKIVKTTSSGTLIQMVQLPLS